MNNVILVGGFLEIIELAEDNFYHIVGVIDPRENKHYKTLGSDDDAAHLAKKYHDTPLLITPDLPKQRERLHHHYRNHHYLFATLISNKATVSRFSTIGTGTIIQQGVNVSPAVEVGEFVKLNTNTNIMHNSKIGSYTTLAPNSVILGYVTIGLRCYVGANATILPHVTICDDAIIGAGSVVIKDIPKEGVYAGVPARLLTIKK